MALTLTARNVSADQTDGAIIRNVEAGAALSVGQAVYINGDGEAELADANGASEAVARVRGVVVNSPNMYGELTIAEGQRCSVCVFGPVYGFTDMDEGADVFVSATAGELTQTAPTPNAYQVRIGYALQSDVLFVSPEVDAATSV